MSESKPPKKNLFRTLLNLLGLFSFIYLSIQLMNTPATSEHQSIKQTIGSISLAFWVGLLVWAMYRLLKKR